MLSKLRFVLPEQQPEGGGGMLQRAAEVVREKGVEPEWEGPGITTRHKGLVYVLDNFDCPDFKLLSGKCRIIGPAVVLAHIDKGWPLPASTQPVFSMAMRGVVACFTQTGAREKREQLSHLVKLMGGKVQKDYTKHVTHLIAGQVGSTKYNVARDLCMPVMLPSWVDHCWTQGLDSYISALDNTILKAHSCPSFTGCTVTVTGLEERERRRVRELVEGNGGAYSGELTKDICTHLLVGSTTSAKYKFAQQWQIFCVSSQWLYDSAEKGYCQSEASYSVEEGGAGGGASGKRKTEKAASVGAPLQWVGVLRDYDLPAPPETTFLDGCRIFLAGFSDQELEKLHKIINLGGGARYNHLSENLTHVVLGVQEPSTVTSIRNMGEIPHVVNVLWLLARCTGGEKVEEHQYKCLDLGPSGEEGDVEGVGKGGQTGKRKRRRPDGEGEGGNKRPRVVMGEGGEVGENDETMLEEEALLLQYQNAEFPVGDDEGGGGGEERDGVLQGMKLAVSCLFSSDDKTLGISVLRDQGGVVVDVQAADYLLSPLEVVNKTGPRRQDELDSHATPVTMIWLQRCIEAGTALEPTSNYLFRPLAVNMVDTILTGCVLAFSQFSDLEREHLIRFSKGLGATVQDYFTHYPGHGLLATTHIILKTGQGTKYDRAVQWGVPAVADSWLFACAESGNIVPVEPHLVHPSPDDMAGGEREEEGREGVGSSGVCDEDLTVAADRGGVEGEVVSDNEEGPRPIDSGVQKGELTDREKGGADGDNALAGVVICLHKKIPSQAHMHNLAGSLGADCHWSFDNSCTHYIYQGKAAEAVRDREVRAARENGCLVVSPHWIHACVSEGSRVQESSYPHTYNPNMALSMKISTQQRREVTKPGVESCDNHMTQQVAGTELEGAEKNGYEKRQEGSVNECGAKQEEGKEEENREENSVTSEMVRKFQQQLEEIKVAPRETRRRKSRRLQQQDPETTAPSAPPPHTNPSLPLHRRSRRNRKRSEVLTDSQISDSQVLQVTYDDPEGRQEKAKLLERIEKEERLRAQGLDPSEYRDSSSSVEERNLHLDLAGSSHTDMTATTAATSSTVSRGQLTVGGSSRAHRGAGRSGTAGDSDKLRGDGRYESGDGDKNAPSSMPLPPSLGVPIVTHPKGNQEVKSLFDERAVQTRRKAKSPPKFLLSSLEQREKLDYGALIQELGGEYIDLDYFTTNCTHLVVGKASRTEKFLGACAAGKWVLHKSYMESCRVERRFVEEEDHEWGVNAGENELQPLEYAPHRWRVALTQQRLAGGVGPDIGAFQGWKALLFAERNKMAGLKRLLEAGGAKVYSSGPKLSMEELKQVSHAFINMNYFPKDSLSLESMVKCGVACLKPDYIAEYLSKGKDVSIEPFFINEVKPVLKRYEE